MPPLHLLPCCPGPQKQQTKLREKHLCCPESDSHSTGGSGKDQKQDVMTHGQTETDLEKIWFSPVNWVAETGRSGGSVCCSGYAQRHALAQIRGLTGCGKAHWWCHYPVKCSKRKTRTPRLTVSWCWGSTVRNDKKVHLVSLLWIARSRNFCDNMVPPLSKAFSRNTVNRARLFSPVLAWWQRPQWRTGWTCQSRDLQARLDGNPGLGQEQPPACRGGRRLQQEIL